MKKANQLINQPTLFCREFPSDCEVKKDKIYLYGQSQEFWSEIANLDPLQTLAQLNCNIFAIHGTSDWVISSENDGGAIEMLLSKKNKFSNKILNGLDHFLLKADSKKSSVETFKGGLKDEKMIIHPELIEEITTVLSKWTK